MTNIKFSGTTLLCVVSYLVTYDLLHLSPLILLVIIIMVLFCLEQVSYLMSYSSSLAKHFVFVTLVTCISFVKTKKHVFQVALLLLNTSFVRIHTVYV